MTDARMPDCWLNDRRVQRLTDHAFRSFTVSLIWSVSNKTDGLIEPEDLPLIPGFSRGDEDELVASTLWGEDDRRWMIVDYRDTQTSKAEHEVLAYGRYKNRERQALFRDPALRLAVRARDGDFCRYCVIVVDWSDRRSSRGGTYDHVIPDGGSLLENLVVCCRGCNARKGNRTPEQAAMVLLDAPECSSSCSSSSGSGARSGARSEAKSEAKTKFITTQDRKDLFSSLNSTSGSNSSSSQAPSLPKPGTVLAATEFSGRPAVLGDPWGPAHPVPYRGASDETRGLVHAHVSKAALHAKRTRDGLYETTQGLVNSGGSDDDIGVALDRWFVRKANGEDLYPGHLDSIYSQVVAEKDVTPSQRRASRKLSTSERNFLDLQSLKTNQNPRELNGSG